MRFSNTVRFLVLSLLCGCGRIDFNVLDVHDAEVPFVEPTGQLDATFGSAGITIVPPGMFDAQPYALVDRAGGAYLAVGVHRGAMMDSHFGLFAFTQSGAVDTAFAANGVVDIGPTTNDYGYGAVQLSDARTVVIGDGDDGLGDFDNMTVGMLDAADRVDPAFGSGGFFRLDVGGLQRGDTTAGVAVAGDKLIVCGTADYLSTDSHFTVLELALDGTPITSFGTSGVVSEDLTPGGRDECTAVVPLPNGNVVASGRSGGRATLASYRADGTRDPGFASNGFTQFAGAGSTAFDMVRAPDGDLVACGDSAGIAFIARFAPDGTPRAGFGQNGIVMLPSLSICWSLAVQPNGKLVATAQTLTGGEGVVVRVAADGTLDPAFGSGGSVTLPTGGSTELRGLLLQTDGAIAVAGFISGTPDHAVIARIR